MEIYWNIQYTANPVLGCSKHSRDPVSYSPGSTVLETELGSRIFFFKYLCGTPWGSNGEEKLHDSLLLGLCGFRPIRKMQEMMPPSLHGCEV